MTPPASHAADLAAHIRRTVAERRAFSDPVAIMRAAGFEPDEWQGAVLRSTALRQILLCSRQSGKSTVTASLAMQVALHHAPALVLLLSPSQRQSAELFRKVLQVYRSLPNAPKEVGESALRLELDTGSRIVALPGAEGTVRGFSGVRLLVVDEAAWVDEALYYAVRPMLAVSGGRLVALSSARGKRGWFYRAWESEEEWERHKVTALDCPRISRAFLADERRALPEPQYRSEYLCEFTDDDQAAFDGADIEAAMSDLPVLFPASDEETALTDDPLLFT